MFNIKLRTFGVLFQIILSIFLAACNSTSKENRDGGTAKNDKYDTSEITIQRGMVLFNQYCASCHDFNESVMGPSLAGITSNVSKDWLINFIENPKENIENGDERAVKLYEKYKVYMPSFESLKKDEVEDLLGFIHKFSEGEKSAQNKRAGGILNPISEKIPASDLTLVIEEFLTIPASSESAPKARINKLLEIQTKKEKRLFIADLRGKLYEIIDGTSEVYLDVKEEIENFIDNPGWGTGLGSFDFHPEFEKNGLLYTTHTEPPKTDMADFGINDSIPSKLQWVLTEWKTNTPDNQKFIGKRREVLRVDMVTAAHGFQELAFNPTVKKGDPDYGLLYVCIGDGASALAGYPFLCDNPSKIWGSVIRINPMGRNSTNGKYGLPKDNPFVNDPNTLDEIWASGFRNPHRISWDENGSRKIFVTNIGQHSLEEVNLLVKGADYGWPNREGTFLYDVTANTEVVYPLPDNDSGYTYPVIQFDHDEGNAVSGGFSYSGTKVPLLRNKYIFGDIPRGTLFYSEVSEIVQGKQAPILKIGLELNGSPTSLSKIADGQRVDLRIGQDSSGELFIFTKSDGKVYKIVGCKTSSDML